MNPSFFNVFLNKKISLYLLRYIYIYPADVIVFTSTDYSRYETGKG